MLRLRYLPSLFGEDDSIGHFVFYSSNKIHINNTEFFTALISMDGNS